MDTEYLKTFCVVSKLKNFSRSAEVLNVTQPCISRRIQSLESELGFALFEKHSRATVLTDNGKEFLTYAERILGIISEGTRSIKERSQTEHLKIAATGTTGFHLLPKLIKKFRASYGNLLTVYTAPSIQIFEMLLDQTIDLGIVTASFSNAVIEQDTLYEEKIVCVGEPNFVKKYFDGPIIVNCPIPVIMNDISSPLGTPANALNQYFLNNEYFSVSVEAQYVQVAEQLARTGLGLAFLPSSAASQGLRSGELVEVTLPDVTIHKRPVYVITRKATSKKNSMLEFKSLLYKLPEIISA